FIRRPPIYTLGYSSAASDVFKRLAIKRDDVCVEETRSFLKRLYRGSLGMMVNSLIEQDAVSKEDIAELYDILKKAEEEQK
ncbi:MAG: BlaI/MecI/CopY family transcriptional regulator, partial [Oscillospiraceae bacterium]|nr:BlaI/MecI/CopY family transcriptional regulator [Oscillospiraceae bacterium]